MVYNLVQRQVFQYRNTPILERLQVAYSKLIKPALRLL